MPIIESQQRREPYTGSAASSSHYDHFVSSDEFIVRKVGEKVRLFFPHSTESGQGVGLVLPSQAVAIAVGLALQSIGEGCLNEMTGRF